MSTTVFPSYIKGMGPTPQEFESFTISNIYNSSNTSLSLLHILLNNSERIIAGSDDSFKEAIGWIIKYDATTNEFGFNQLVVAVNSDGSYEAPILIGIDALISNTPLVASAFGRNIVDERKNHRPRSMDVTPSEISATEYVAKDYTSKDFFDAVSTDTTNYNKLNIFQDDSATKAFYLSRPQAEVMFSFLNYAEVLSSGVDYEVVFSGARVQTGRMVDRSNMKELEDLQRNNLNVDMSSWFTLKMEIVTKSRFPLIYLPVLNQNRASLPIVQFLDPCPPGYRLYNDIRLFFNKKFFFNGVYQNSKFGKLLNHGVNVASYKKLWDLQSRNGVAAMELILGNGSISSI